MFNKFFLFNLPIGNWLPELFPTDRQKIRHPAPIFWWTPPNPVSSQDVVLSRIPQRILVKSRIPKSTLANLVSARHLFKADSVVSHYTLTVYRPVRVSRTDSLNHWYHISVVSLQAGLLRDGYCGPVPNGISVFERVDCTSTNEIPVHSYTWRIGHYRDNHRVLNNRKKISTRSSILYPRERVSIHVVDKCPIWWTPIMEQL